MQLPPIKLNENEQVGKVMVIAQVHNWETGKTSLYINCSEDTTWIDQRGMLSAAQYMIDFPEEVDNASD